MKVKVIYITEQLNHYRVPIFELIAKNSMIDLTIAHCGQNKVTDENLFKEVIITLCNLGPFSYFKENIPVLSSRFNVVIATSSLRNLSLFKLSLLKKRTFKLAYWGIGVRASYKHKFDSPTVLNRVRLFLANRSDAMIYYSEYAKNKYVNKGVPSEKLFVMPNTVKVAETHSISNYKNCILFIGTLYKQKKILILLQSYLNAYKVNPHIPSLLVVGDGPERETIIRWIKANELSHKVRLYGQIYDENQKAALFSESLACISPGQAGLSVLSSFGYGVPFITHEDSITGGERLNIKSGVNGILYNSHDQLVDIILDISYHNEKYIKMGINAKNFYSKKRKPEQMAKGFIDAVKYMSLK